MMFPGGEVLRRLVVTLRLQITGAVHHQTRVGRHLADHGLIQGFRIGRFALHCDPRREGRAARGAGHRIETRRVVRIFRE